MKMAHVRYAAILAAMFSSFPAFASDQVNNPPPAKIPTLLQNQGNANMPGETYSDPAKFQGTDFNLLSRKGELMMMKQDMKNIYDALSGVIIKKSSSNTGSVQIAVETPAIAPSFFVKSALYFSPVNWSVWVNNRKFTPFYNKSYLANGDIDFEIVSVDHDRMRLIWNTNYLDAISPGWQQKFSAAAPSADHTLKEPGFISPSGKVFVSQDSTKVEITLAPNQTFVTHTMEVEEGYQPPFQIKAPAATEAKINVNPQTNINPETQQK